MAEKKIFFGEILSSKFPKLHLNAKNRKKNANFPKEKNANKRKKRNLRFAACPAWDQISGWDDKGAQRKSIALTLQPCPKKNMNSAFLGAYSRITERRPEARKEG